MGIFHSSVSLPEGNSLLLMVHQPFSDTSYDHPPFLLRGAETGRIWKHRPEPLPVVAGRFLMNQNWLYPLVI